MGDTRQGQHIPGLKTGSIKDNRKLAWPRNKAKKVIIHEKTSVKKVVSKGRKQEQPNSRGLSVKIL